MTESGRLQGRPGEEGQEVKETNNWVEPGLPKPDLSTTAYAYMGDAVYETFVREKVMATGEVHVDSLHRMAVAYVCAGGQAKAVKAMMADGFLSEEETALVKRARNHKTLSKAKNADPVTYKLATAFEALVGYLYLSGQRERMEAVIGEALRIIENKAAASAENKNAESK